jgi:DNA modification methylase
VATSLLLLWAALPGYERVQRALKAAEHVTFDPKAFAAWRERIRPEDVPAGKDVVFTPDSEADRIEQAFRERVKWWTC